MKTKLLTAALLLGMSLAPISIARTQPVEQKIDYRNEFYSKISQKDKYNTLIEFTLNPEIGKENSISTITGIAFPDTNEIRYLEINEEVSDGSKDGTFLKRAYFTTFNQKAGINDDNISTLRVRIVLEEYLRQGNDMILKTKTLEDGGFSNGKPDGKADVVIKGTIKFPITKREDYDVNYEKITPEDQKEFDDTIDRFFEQYRANKATSI